MGVLLKRGEDIQGAHKENTMGQGRQRSELCIHKTRDTKAGWKLGIGRADFPQSRQKKPDPADTLISNFWPLGLSGNTFLLLSQRRFGGHCYRGHRHSQDL